MLFERTRKVAELRGMQLQEVFEAAGLEKSTLYAWENDEDNISYASIRSVANVLDVSVHQLLGSTQNLTPIRNEKDSVEKEIEALFNRYARATNLTPEETATFNENMHDYMIYRSKKLKEIRDLNQG